MKNVIKFFKSILSSPFSWGPLTLIWMVSFIPFYEWWNTQALLIWFIATIIILGMGHSVITKCNDVFHHDTDENNINTKINN